MLFIIIKNTFNNDLYFEYECLKISRTYPFTIQIIHCLTALLVIALFTLGFWITNRSAGNL